QNRLPWRIRMRAIIRSMMGSLMTTAMPLPFGAFAHDQHSSSPQLKRVAKERDRDKDRGGREEHPVIEESIRQLEHVKDELEGHRVGLSGTSMRRFTSCTLR